MPYSNEIHHLIIVTIMIMMMAIAIMIEAEAPTYPSPLLIDLPFLLRPI
jgi:hypothetical protein